jgi:hypothetical protein
MQVESNETPYEVRCHGCQVSFPVGTRHCVHCGERLGRGRRRLVPTLDSDEPWAPDELEEEASADATATRRRFISPFTLMWLVAAIALSIQRACAGE